MDIQQVVFTERGRAQMQTRALPEPGSGEVLVESLFSVISPGTELAVFRGLTDANFPYPPGYSVCGRVARCGPGVQSPREGEYVVTEGLHASHMVAPAAECFRVAVGVDAVGVDPMEAAAYRMAVIALQGVRKAQVQLGESVLVIGLGVIGQLAGQIARLSGATTIAGIDPLPARRQLAANVGFDHTAENADVLVTPDGGWDVVVEATGVPAPINDALRLARRLGRVVLLGSTRGQTGQVDFYRDVHRKGLTVLGAHDSTRPRFEDASTTRTLGSDTRIVLQFLAQQRLKLRPLITQIVPAAQAPQIYESLANNGSAVLTVALDWRRIV
jgi:2-desacetyl-2-hydroxyethyl bacteriochlorophyllide A dehydrogenase